MLCQQRALVMCLHRVILYTRRVYTSIRVYTSRVIFYTHATSSSSYSNNIKIMMAIDTTTNQPLLLLLLLLLLLFRP